MIRRFAVVSPADLAAMEEFVSSGTCGNVARVWSAARKRENRTWDGRIYVVFDTEHKGARNATVYRLGLDGETHIIAKLHYNKALKWCSNNLRPAA